MFKPYLAKVTWEDASSSDQAGYTYTQKEWADKYDPFIVESVGFILQLDKKIVILSAWRTLKNTRQSEDEFRGCMRIPRGMVRKIRRIRG